MTAYQARRLTPDSPDYPRGYRYLEEPPVVFVKGTLVAGPHVAIVGTRRCTRYGVGHARACGRALSDLGWIVVSGLARGIDAAAHQGIVDVPGRGVAVLGCGIDRVYPKENTQLLHRILETGGAVVSEYPGETPPDKWRFPARNRLIAAMSDAVVVVEAGIKGGAQITALLAAEMGIPVFAFPGDVDRAASAGTNRLIRDGAIPVLGAADLVEELSFLPGFDQTGSKSGEEVSGLPVSGVDLEELPDLWGCSIAEALALVGKLESEGRVERSGDRVVPIAGAKR